MVILKPLKFLECLLRNLDKYVEYTTTLHKVSHCTGKLDVLQLTAIYTVLSYSAFLGGVWCFHALKLGLYEG
jgi:hypothetical protein